MTVCDRCGQALGISRTACLASSVQVDGRGAVPRVVSEDQCAGCGVPAGGHHHAGCDRERCPVCGGFLTMCEVMGCLAGRVSA